MSGPVSGSNRVKRGGNWNNNANNCRVANRNNNSPGNENNNLGFRLVSTTHGKDQRCPIHDRPSPANTGTNKAGTMGPVPGGASDRGTSRRTLSEEPRIANKQVDSYRRQPRRYALRLPSSGHLRRWLIRKEVHQRKSHH